MEKTKTIETIKSCLIVVLSLSAVLLLYFFWENLSLKNIRWAWNAESEEVQQPVEVPEIQEVILPIEVQIHLEGELYAVILPEDYDSWRTGVMALARFSKGDGYVEEISKEKYDEVMSYRSLQIEFAYNVPFEGFCRQFGVAYAKYGAVRNVTLLAYSEATPESLFIYDRAANRYYRLVGPEQETAPFSQLIQAVESDGTYDPYYPASSYMGVEESDAVLPVYLERSLTRVTVTQAYSGENRDASAAEFAQTFFGESFDFTRRLEDSTGTITYMYDYGSKVLTVDDKGIAIYKEELSDPVSTQGFYGSLDTAIQFVGEHGGWYPKCEELRLEEYGLTPFLWTGQEIQQSGRSGYRFAFGFRRGNEVFYSNEGPAIIVEVFDGQVTYYFRNVFEAVLVRGIVSSLWEANDSANTIAQNYDWIYETLKTTGNYTFEDGKKEEKGEARFDRVAGDVERVQEGYLINSKSGSALADRCWVIQIDGVLFYFDLFSGEALGYTAVGR
ncbi:MAG: hypothetical protein E7223_07995 [Clostridiales bacterium]|nr:hypothetical protein [Clostridiales bacterium]